MTPDVVVDIGNSRMKWGRCLPTVADGGWVSLPLDDMNAWDEQLAVWGLEAKSRFAVGSVNPPVTEVFARWVEAHGGTCVIFRKPSELPIRLNVDEPDAVGIDRVFGALAARAMVPPNTPAITVDVGTAVTVNLIDADGIFQGGGIFPGPRLMALALHQNTAKLPLVDLLETTHPEEAPGKNTVSAIRLGIDCVVYGGTHSLICLLAEQSLILPWLFITGGGHKIFEGYSSEAVAELRVIPHLNLEGIRIAAEALP